MITCVASAGHSVPCRGLPTRPARPATPERAPAAQAGHCYYCKLQASEAQGLKPGGDRRSRCNKPALGERQRRDQRAIGPRELKGAPPRAKTIPQSTEIRLFLRVGPSFPWGREQSQTNACRHISSKSGDFRASPRLERGREKKEESPQKPNPHWRQRWRSLVGLIRLRGMTG